MAPSFYEKIMTYRAFGLNIVSDIPIPTIEPCENERKPDIVIKRVSGMYEDDRETYAAGEADGSLFYHIADVGSFRISGGSEILVDAPAATDDRQVALYLLGRCMGATFQQRGWLALHGSCVCHEGKTVLICGESGAGKSTLASEFLKNGWNLMTDDVALLIQKNGKYHVRSSYPSQKLWKDTISVYDRDNGTLLPLLQESRRDKYHVKLDQSFFDGELELSMIAELSVGTGERSFSELKGTAKIAHIIENIYLKRILTDEEQNGAAIRSAVLLSQQVKMYSCVRNNDRNCPAYFYQRIEENV